MQGRKRVSAEDGRPGGQTFQQTFLAPRLLCIQSGARVHSKYSQRTNRMPFKQFGEAPHHGSANHYNQDAAVAGVIDEDFLNQPPARQRAMLHRATGDRSLLSMSDEGTDRYITNAINQIEARDIGGAHAASPMHAQDGAEGVDPQLMQAMEQAAGADDMQAANSLLRSAKRRSGGQRDVRHEHSSRRPASGGQRFDAGRIRSALG